MVEETVINARMSPLRVWSTLSDLAGYRQWHPHYYFKRVAPSGSHAELSRPFLEMRRFSTWVELLREPRPFVFGWKSRRSKLIDFMERYEIAPTGDGSEVRHIVTFGGIFGGLAGLFLRSAIREEMRAHDDALQKALKRQELRPLTKNRRRLAETSRRAAND